MLRSAHYQCQTCVDTHVVHAGLLAVQIPLQQQATSSLALLQVLLAQLMDRSPLLACE